MMDTSKYLGVFIMPKLQMEISRGINFCGAQICLN